jgi:protein O-GlcNAc transferase
VLQERGDLAGARRAYERVLSSSPELPGALWNLALVLEREGKAEEAEGYFEKLVAVSPNFEDAAFRLGFLQLQRAEYASAVDSFETCLKKRKDWLEALLNLGLACWKFEDLDAAAETFGRALALDPKNIDALRALTAIAIERKDHQRGWELLQKLTALGERPVELSYNLGLLLQSAGENSSAVECYRIAVEKKPDFSEALLNLGHALKAIGKEDEARLVWSEAVTADPALAEQYFH